MQRAVVRRDREWSVFDGVPVHRVEEVDHADLDPVAGEPCLVPVVRPDVALGASRGRPVLLEPLDQLARCLRDLLGADVDRDRISDDDVGLGPDVVDLGDGIVGDLDEDDAGRGGEHGPALLGHLPDELGLCGSVVDEDLDRGQVIGGRGLWGRAPGR